MSRIIGGEDTKRRVPLKRVGETALALVVLWEIGGALNTHLGDHRVESEATAIETPAHAPATRCPWRVQSVMAVPGQSGWAYSGWSHHIGRIPGARSCPELPNGIVAFSRFGDDYLRVADVTYAQLATPLAPRDFGH